MISNKLDFIKENFEKLDQKSLAQKVLANIKTKQGDLTSYFGELDKSNYYNKLNICINQGRAYNTGEATLKLWKHFYENGFITFDELKSAQTNKIQPKIRDHSKSFDELWEDIGDDSDGTDAQAEVANDLKNLIIENCSEIDVFIKDPSGEPFLEFYNNVVQRKFYVDYSTEEISDPKIIDLMSELSTIIDKLMGLTVNNDGKSTRYDFLGSADRIKNKLRGYEIFEKLKKDKIYLSLAKDIENYVFSSKTEIVNNNLILKTNISVVTTMSLVFGNKENYKPKQYRPYNEIINDHAHKAANILKSHLIIGKQPVNESLVNFPTSKNKSNK